jgi:TonB family protein
MAGDEIGTPTSAPVAKDGTVTGPPLAKGLIREVMQANQPKVRYCYERELAKSPNLAGAVVVKFVIRADGTVASAVVASSTLGNGAVERCITAAVAKFVFPKPLGGGNVVVSYPQQAADQRYCRAARWSLSPMERYLLALPILVAAYWLVLYSSDDHLIDAQPAHDEERHGGEPARWQRLHHPS